MAFFTGKMYNNLVAVSFALLCPLFFPSQAHAHGVYIFAWAEDGKICTESYFGGKKQVKNGEVLMMDSGGAVLATASTGSEGICCFEAPAAEGDLHFLLRAGQGHQGEFILPGVEAAFARNQPGGAHSRPGSTSSGVPGTLASPPGAQDASGTSVGLAGALPAASATSSTGQAKTAEAVAGSNAGVSPGAAVLLSNRQDSNTAAIPADSADSSLSTVTEERLRVLLRDEIRAAMIPLGRVMAGKDDAGPGLRDIAGGLGWIIGLAGIAAWWSSRKKAL